MDRVSPKLVALALGPGRREWRQVACARLGRASAGRNRVQTGTAQFQRRARAKVLFPAANH